MTVTPAEIDRVVGQNIRDIRRARKRSQADLAEFLGISFQQVQKYESGRNRVSASSLFLISGWLDVHLDAFFHDGLGKVRISPTSFDREVLELAAIIDRVDPPPLRKALASLAYEVVALGRRLVA